MRNVKSVCKKMVVLVGVIGCTMACLTGCGKSGTAVVDADENATSIQVPMEDGSTMDLPVNPEGDVTVTDFTAVAGEYKAEDGSTMSIKEDGKVSITIDGVDTIEGTATMIVKGIMPIAAKDANGKDLSLEFATESNELMVVDSSWDQLTNGKTIAFSK